MVKWCHLLHNALVASGFCAGLLDLPPICRLAEEEWKRRVSVCLWVRTLSRICGKMCKLFFFFPSKSNWTSKWWSQWFVCCRCRAAPPISTIPTTPLGNECWPQDSQMNMLVRPPTDFPWFLWHLYASWPFVSLPSSWVTQTQTCLSTKNCSICHPSYLPKMMPTRWSPPSLLPPITRENVALSCVSKNLAPQSLSPPPWVKRTIRFLMNEWQMSGFLLR